MTIICSIGVGVLTFPCCVPNNNLDKQVTPTPWHLKSRQLPGISTLNTYTVLSVSVLHVYKTNIEIQPLLK